MSSILLLLLTCGAVNWGYAYPICFSYVVILRQLLLKTKYDAKIYCNYLYSLDFWLLLFSGMSFAFIGLRNFTSLYHYGILPIIAYIIGWYLLEESDCKRTRDYILTLVCGFSIYAMLNDIINIGKNRYMLIDFWTGTFRAATGSGILNTLTVAILFYMLFVEKRRVIKIIYFILFACTLQYMFLLGTRTQFLILIVVNILVGLIFSYQKNGLVGMFKILGLILFIVFCIVLIYKIDFLSIQEKIANTNLAYRYTNKASLARSDEFRLEYFLEGIKNLFSYPLGGRIEQTYRHNMWLDVGRISGIIPFLSLLFYSIFCFYKMHKIFSNKMVLMELRYLLLSVYIGAYINFFVEPIWEGQFNFFLAMCVIDGIVGSLERKIKNEQSSEKSISIALPIRPDM